MALHTPARPESKTPATAKPRITITASGREALKLYEQEIATYLRELPHLLAEAYAGRHVLVKGDKLHSVWDTREDAIQAGRKSFGLEPIFVKTIDPRDPERFALLSTRKTPYARPERLPFKILRPPRGPGSRTPALGQSSYEVRAEPGI